MKHIFSIHSHLTFLVAYSTIKHLNLNKDDVILLCSNYKVKVGGYKAVPGYSSRYSGMLHKILNFNVPKAHDKYIDTLTGGENYISYIDLMSYYQKILISNTKCVGLHFIDEGTITFQEFDGLTDLTWPERDTPYRISNIFGKNFRKTFLRILRGYNIRLLSIPYHYMAYTSFEDLKFFSFSNNAYYNAPPHKKIVLRPKPDDDLIQMALNIKLENEVIWVDGSMGKFTGLPDEYYHRAIDKAIVILKERRIILNTVYVKLRKGVDENSNYLINALRSTKVIVNIVPEDTVLEALFLVSTKCTVIGNLSSALEYAHCFGHKSYSIYSLFEKRPPTFYDKIKGYWDNVERL